MGTELKNKRREKRKLRKNIRSINISLSTSLLVIVYNALLHQVNTAVKNQKIKVINLRHGKKLRNLKLKQETTNTLMNVNVPTLNTPYIISHLEKHILKKKIFLLYDILFIRCKFKCYSHHFIIYMS